MRRYLPERVVTYVMPKPAVPVSWSETWPRITDTLYLLTGRKP